MATKRKSKPKSTAPRKAAAPTAPKRKRRKRKASKRRKSPAAASGSSSSKRTRKPLQLVLRVEDVPVDSAALSRLSDGQRLDLAVLPPQRTFSKRPAWATDEATWRKAVRVVGPHWRKLRHPWPTVAWVYLRMDGTVGSGRGLAQKRSDDEETTRGRGRSSARARPTTPSTRLQYADAEDEALPVRVERLQVDETGIDEQGNYRGRGMWWRVWNASIDSVVRAASAAAARAIVMGRAH